MNSGPSAAHWLGTDGVGRDTLARLMQGGRISLMVAAVSVLISVVIGFLLGALRRHGGAGRRCGDHALRRSMR
jgi:peptide/nickel transport system permease protein